MSLLDNFPHLCSARFRDRARGPIGGSSDDFSGVVFTDRECWRQVARHSEIELFEKRGITVTDKIYFLTDPLLDERHNIEDVRDKDMTAGTGQTLEVRSRAIPDAAAGLGVVYKVMAEITTVGSI